MKSSQLRDLTRKYAAGGLDRDEYIAERKRLIDGVVAGELDLRYRDVGPAAPVDWHASRRRWWIVGGTLMLVGMLLVAVVAYFLDPDGSNKDPVTAVSPVPADPGADLLHDFVRQGQWTQASLDALESDWQKLTPFQQESARRSSFYRHMKHETSQRILEQEALLATGEVDALLLVARLREFADKVGFAD